MAKAPKYELNIQQSRDPKMDGEVMFKAVIVDSETGEVAQFLGGKSLTVADVQAKKHDALRGEMMEWARKCYDGHPNRDQFRIQESK